MRSLNHHYHDNPLEEDRQAAASLHYAVVLFIITSMMIFFGMTVLYSTSYGVVGPMYFKKQLLWSGVGLVCGLATFMFGYKRLVQLSPALILASLALLLIALFFPERKGAHRWIIIPGVGSIQPSEYAKIALSLFLAKYCSDKMRNLSTLALRGGFLPGVATAGVIMLLVLAGKDLGTTILLGIVTVIVFFVAGLRLRWLVPPFVIAPPLIVWFVYKFDPVRWARITSFMHPELYHRADGYQLWNSMLALGSGNWFGVGFMASRLKHKYLPEAHTDFILSIVGEELGMVGIGCVVFAYLAFMFVAIRISVNSSTRQGMLLGTAITALILLQAFINLGVVSGSLPTKGMPAPFISYGGSNLVVCMILTSLLLSIAVETARPDFNREILNELRNFGARLWHKWI